MATLSVAARNAALDAVVAHLYSGTAVAGPIFRWQTAGGALNLNNNLTLTTFNAASGGEASFSGTLTVAANSNAPADIAELVWLNRDVVQVLQATVGLVGSGEDIEFNGTVSVVVGQLIRLNTFTLAIT